MIKKPQEVEQFVDALQGQSIVDIKRRGKFRFFIQSYMPLFPICE